MRLVLSTIHVLASDEESTWGTGMNLARSHYTAKFGVRSRLLQG
jgi:hypothetical protein